LIWPGKYNAGGSRSAPVLSKPPLPVVEIAEARGDKGGNSGQEDPTWRNKLVLGDNLEVMGSLLGELAGEVDLIYIDPPFATGGSFSYKTDMGQGRSGPDGAGMTHVETAYQDRWAMGAYLQMLDHRLHLMRDLLSERGSLMVHVDYRANSHLRLLLDEIFGPKAMINEIAWCYGGGGAPQRYYPRKHDTILWYARGREWTFNRQFRPYTEGTAQRGLTQVKGPRYRLRPEGAGLDDWWHGKEVQKILSPTAYENLKYPTQKPEGLLRRIILGHSNPGDVVADLFCGAGTTLAVAEKCGRRWIGCDSGRRALQVTRKRLLEIPDRAPFEILHQAHRHSSIPASGIGATLQWRIQQEGARRVRVVLTGIAVPDLDLAPDQQGETPVQWRDLIDSWGVCWDPVAGGSLCLDWFDLRTRQKPEVVLKSPTHTYSGAGRHRITVHLVDVLGNEVQETREVQVL